MSKTSTKAKPKKISTDTITLADQIQALHTRIKQEESQLSRLYDKAVAQEKKQLKQLSTQITRLKTKSEVLSRQLKEATAKFNTKQTTANQARVKKLKAQAPAIKAELETQRAEKVRLTTQHKILTLSHKKFTAQAKAQALFETTWEKSLVKKKSKKRRVIKQKMSPVAKDKPVR